MTKDRQNNLFTICEVCGGTGKAPQELTNIQCVCGGIGFVPCGLTLTQFNHFKKLADQRDPLLAACKAAIDPKNFDTGYDRLYGDTMSKIEAAIKLAES